jgi:hypothetical protein
MRHASGTGTNQPSADSQCPASFMALPHFLMQLVRVGRMPESSGIFATGQEPCNAMCLKWQE